MLIALTSISEIALSVVLDNPGAILLTNSASVAAQLKQYKLPVQNIYCTPQITHEDRDKQFAELAMPGVFDDATFPRTELPIYEVLSIDRLSFWNRSTISEIEQELIRSLEWDKAIVDLNIYETLPFVVMHEAKKRGAYITAVETVHLKSREVLLLGEYLQFDEYIVGGDWQFLKRANVKGKIISVGETDRRQIVNPSEQSFQTGLTAVVFDKEFEWEYRRFLETSSGVVSTIVFDDRSKELLFKCVPQPYHHRIILADTNAGYKKIVAFGWRSYLQQYKKNVDIYDFGGKTLAQEIIAQ
jgi:hypothetical protein